MSLTKAALLEQAKPRVELVKDVEGWDVDVWIRSYPQALMSSRGGELRDADGNFDLALADVFTIIDQVMVSETELMFTEDDIDALSELDGQRLQPLLLAIQQFNAGDPKKTIPNE